jgi:hypothetical protein
MNIMDDQSSAPVALQLANGVIGKKANVLLGPTRVSLSPQR